MKSEIPVRTTKAPTPMATAEPPLSPLLPPAVVVVGTSVVGGAVVVGPEGAGNPGENGLEG
jgi:hypothetical protein